MKFRKKPIVIDAEQYHEGLEDGFDFGVLINGVFQEVDQDHCKGIGGKLPYINTLEGKHYINPTDWIVTGIKNERYPVKNDIFWMTYEKVE